MLHRLKHEELQKENKDISTGRRISSLPDKKPEIPDEKQTWERFLEGDEGAFIAIYDTYFEELCHFGIQYVSLTQVEDCIQDLFIDLRQKRKKLPGIKNSIRLFLFQCLKRRILNLKKGNRREGVFHESFEFSLPHESLVIFHQEQKERMEKLDRALRSLDAKQREAVYYYFYKGMDYGEIRKLMGYRNVKSVRNLIYRVVKVLRTHF
ncbi:sigma-70 family RNA polymerase sigma factor [Sinomicrobium kalidii]|uniref:RNA polymerase sigma factor n=1 Tax=Sinomicrobium kalidii TaxID=2900738 RepID=UPI001E42815A|nr:sigma-70 family RNA polymerase sigma factor [Sinomicrobium kalidii]UGU17490.1 sigma-70 family RNA polymerase sigma factor [Sinomicrobium kalidii]